MTGDRSGGVVLTESERAAVCTCSWTYFGVVDGDAHERQCTLHREAVEAIVAGRLAAVGDVLREGLADESLEATGVMERALAALTATTEEQA